MLAIQMHCREAMRIGRRLAVVAVAAVSASTLYAAERVLPECKAAAAALAHFVDRRPSAPPWNPETINIDASLPKLAKHASLNAIRRIPTAGHPQYEQVEIGGDHLVAREVIARYLSAEDQAAGIPVAAVAMTPQNYKFSYQGRVQSGDATTYRFLITPRKKHQGLLKGELWLTDAGIATRQSGYLVKKPSVFVKRILVTREMSVKDSAVEKRITHLSVETRIVGSAELVIEERPDEYASPPAPEGERLTACRQTHEQRSELLSVKAVALASSDR